ncbi:type IV secretory system conjugative DNA transfer family protein [Phototrophicus methaneseepsis]|uniref:Type IV secretory system conjugative DNA transfer family protein n=1 Tax=Phototrophicus methaneseepsis TaxID=2710758 RepID=A0A7S8IDM5_9CHLR|nr:type IV secretory system conjugative DNA transfer family protein [Phototrophicus methaneseepsis]QPC81702.1 type IV secretory system conjugative DNA transfer family protein [Phototrophicus methaneseepsis]
MLYWLFTDGRGFLSSLITPLLCLSLFMPLFVSAIIGAGIQRSSQVTGDSGWKHTAKWVTIATVLLAVTTVYLMLVSDMAIQPIRGKSTANSFIRLLVGGPENIHHMRLFMFGMMLGFLWMIVTIGLQSGLKNGGWLRERVDRLRTPRVKRGALGSSHFCSQCEYKRFRREDPEGLILLGAFWGENKQRLDLGTGRFCLGGEDIARGILTLGGPGSGKTQGIILPAIADRMLSGHSLVVADPQGEITAHVLKYAAVTRHLVVVHDPTSTIGPRYNLAEGIDNVSDARAIADVLVPSAQGDNKFWTDSAAALLAACLIRFPNLGEIYNAMNDLKALAQKLAEKKDDAALLANSFIASVGSDGKVASNVVATLATALTGWASTEVRDNTAASDFDAELIVEQPTVVVLTYPGRMRAVYASYLGATLRKVMLDLDTIGERNKGPLPMPVGVILDEFPTLGKLDSLVADVNLVRKRRISILIGAQTKGQFHMIYGSEGTQALFTGLATQVIYGGCDADTTEFYSKASGTATTDANADDPNSHLRQRPLLTVDEVITPQVGNCTIFARYVEAGFATQVVLNARLTRFYERQDWKQHLKAGESTTPLLLERGISLKIEPLPLHQEEVKRDKLREAAQSAMDKAVEHAGNVQFTGLSTMRRNFEERKELMEVIET